MPNEEGREELQDQPLPMVIGGITDFDAMMPEPRHARIGGKVIDVTLIPAQLALDIARFADASQRGEMDNETTLNRMWTLVTEVCKKSDPTVTVEWLLANTTCERLFAFADFVIEPLSKRGNARPARPRKR